MCKTNIFFKNLFIVRKNTASTPDLAPHGTSPLQISSLIFHFYHC